MVAAMIRKGSQPETYSQLLIVRLVEVDKIIGVGQMHHLLVEQIVKLADGANYDFVIRHLIQDDIAALGQQDLPK